MVADEIAWLGDKGRQLLNDYDRLQPKHKLLTFHDVEDVWQKVIIPVLLDFESMKDIWDGQESIPEDSPWYANLKIPDNWR